MNPYFHIFKYNLLLKKIIFFQIVHSKGRYIDIFQLNSNKALIQTNLNFVKALGFLNENLLKEVTKPIRLYPKIKIKRYIQDIITPPILVYFTTIIIIIFIFLIVKTIN